MLGVLLSKWGMGEGESEQGEGEQGEGGSGRDFCLASLFLFLTGVGDVVGVGQGEGGKKCEEPGTGSDTLFVFLVDVGEMAEVGHGDRWVQWGEGGTDSSLEGERQNDDSGIFCGEGRETLICEGEEGDDWGRVVGLRGADLVMSITLIWLASCHPLSCHLSSRLSSDSSLRVEPASMLSMLATVSWYGWELCLLAASSS